MGKSCQVIWKVGKNVFNICLSTLEIFSCCNVDAHCVCDSI